MRIIETVLIVANLLALFLSFKKQSRRARLAVAGINLLFLFLHGVFEGFRYQMAFSYVFVVWLVLNALTGTNRTFESKTRKLLRVLGSVVAFLLLGATAFLAYALPVFRLPQPTGEDAVGIQYFHLTDDSRTDPFLDNSPQNRELMIKIYYPAKQDRSKPFAPYFHSPQLVKSFAVFHGMPDFLFDELNLVKTNSKEQLRLSDQQPVYPVILFSHGAGTSMETQTSQSEDLASHGYIVVDIDHTYVSAASVFPDRIVSSKEATTDFGPDPAASITQIMADDASFVIDQLEKMNEGKIESVFRGRLDLEKIGAIGHSVGGAVAYNLAINDPRVKAAIDLDGVVYVTPKGGAGAMAPFLMLANDRYHIQAIQNRETLREKLDEMTDVDRDIALSIYGSAKAYEQAYMRDQQNVIGLTEVLKTSGNLYTIEGSDHMKFTDMGLFLGFRPLRELIGIGGTTDPSRCLEITKALTLAFFDQYLKGTTTHPLAATVQKYPELKNVELR